MNKSKLLKLLNNKLKIKDICNKLQISESSYYRLLKKYNLKSTNKNKKQVKDNYFENINTQNKAYLLGFFLADGHLRSQQKSKKLNYFILTLKSLDVEVLKFYKSNICKDSNITIIKRSCGYKTCNIRWTSEKMANSIIKNIKGTFKRKSFNKNFSFDIDKIPNNLFRHFVRGFIDADGHIHKGFPRIDILFNSKTFAEKFKNKLEITLNKNVNIFIRKDSYYNKTKKLKRKIPLYRLHINSMKKNEFKNQTLIVKNGRILYYINNIHDYLYKNSNLFLNRKKSTFVKYRANFINNGKVIK